jgi:hypothetical protein
MDFIKNCRTTALAIVCAWYLPADVHPIANPSQHGFATLKYTAYYVQRNLQDDTDEGEKCSMTDYLHVVESELQNRGLLAVSYCLRRAMVVFHGEAKADDGQGSSPDPPQLDGYVFRSGF